MKPSEPKDLEDMIMMSSASQIFLAKYSADEVGRAIEDMKELATAIRQWIRREVGAMNNVGHYNDALEDVIDKLCGGVK